MNRVKTAERAPPPVRQTFRPAGIFQGQRRPWEIACADGIVPHTGTACLKIVQSDEGCSNTLTPLAFPTVPDPKALNTSI